MHRTIRRVALLTLIGAAAIAGPALAQGRGGHGGGGGHAGTAGRAGGGAAGGPGGHGGAPSSVHRSNNVVFVGGYFYDPFFGPYPWWPSPAYPYPYYPLYEDRTILRVIATPKDAAVYADGFYAGTIHDFNGFFQGLPLSPGGHDIVLFLEGYRTIRRQVYLSPGSTFKLKETLEALPAGGTSEPPTEAPALPPPPEGSYLPPHTASRRSPAPGAEARPRTGVGTVSLRVQPPGADVSIDGERWASSDPGHFVLQLSAGPHRLEVTSDGFQIHSSEMIVREQETTTLNVSLLPQ